MNRRPVITIGGHNGSGKSSTAKAVAAALSYAHYSGGDFMRTLAQERNLSLAELGRQAETDSSIDLLIDERQKTFIETHDHFVIDSRLGFFWAPNGFNVFLTIEPRIAAERVFVDRQNNPLRKQTEDAETVDEIAASLAERLESERRRYREIYGIEDHTDPSHYDLVIDTGRKGNTLDMVVDRIITAYRAWCG